MQVVVGADAISIAVGCSDSQAVGIEVHTAPAWCGYWAGTRRSTVVSGERVAVMTSRPTSATTACTLDSSAATTIEGERPSSIVTADGAINARDRGAIARASALDPHNSLIRFNMLMIKRDDTVLSEATALCRQSLERQPTSPEILTNLAVCLQFTGHYDEAVETLAASYGLALRETVSMPANNLSVVFERQRAGE